MMVFSFDDKIIAPLKCGTRYLRSLDLTYVPIYLNSDDWKRAYENKWELIVLRDPIDHLKSALKTEILNMLNGHDLWEGMTIEKILDRFLEEDGCDHWSGNLYRNIYELWAHQNCSPKIIHLDDLSYFTSIKNINIPFIKEKYDFSNFKISMGKEEILDMIKEDYPSHFNRLIEQMENDSKYYANLRFEKIKKKLL